MRGKRAAPVSALRAILPLMTLGTAAQPALAATPDPVSLLSAASVGALIALAALGAAQLWRQRREHADARRALAIAADAWWRADDSMRVVEVGYGQRVVQDFDARRLVGRRPWEIGDDARVPTPLTQAVAERAPFFDQLVDASIGGATRVVAVSGTPLFAAGRFAGYVGTVRDVTDSMATSRAPNREQSELIARLQTDFTERTRQFELAVKDLDSFAHSLSHDLRAPLRVVDGFANIVLEDYGNRLDDLGREHVRRIIAAGNRMNSMIDTLLAMSRTTSRELQRERVDLSKLSREVADELSAQAGPAAPPAEFVITEQLVVDGDRTLLRLVLQNLLGNAHKFTSRVPRPRIEFGVRSDAGSGGRSVVSYFVRDNGAGFDMRFADKLFGLFQRFHSQNEFPGTGVGLATVQRIVRKHGGRIWAESAPGQGATFFFTLWEEK